MKVIAESDNTTTLDGSNTFLLTKNETAFSCEGQPPVNIVRWTIYGAQPGARLRATWAALKWIWQS